MEELPALLAALYAGLVIGALYDALRPLRLFSQGRLWNGLLDVLYYGLVFFVAAFALFYINGGAPRAYLLLGICLGDGLNYRWESMLSWLRKRASGSKKYAWLF